MYYNRKVCCCGACLICSVCYEQQKIIKRYKRTPFEVCADSTALRWDCKTILICDAFDCSVVWCIFFFHPSTSYKFILQSIMCFRLNKIHICIKLIQWCCVCVCVFLSYAYGIYDAFHFWSQFPELPPRLFSAYRTFNVYRCLPVVDSLTLSFYLYICVYMPHWSISQTHIKSERILRMAIHKSFDL